MLAYLVGVMKLTTLLNNGLNVRDGIILTSLRDGGLPPKSLVSELMSAANVTKIGDKLSSLNLIKRKSNKLDKRSVVLSLTKKGKDLVSGH